MTLIQQLTACVLTNRKKIDKHIDNLRYVTRMTRDSKTPEQLQQNVLLTSVGAISGDVLDDVLRHIAAGAAKEDPFEMFKEALMRLEATDKIGKLHQL